ncbi:carbohydrate esterase family 4 protein [Macroventuria anomochaeta]|uniref:Carbohydrate esterase family 4 protein n=1 Tax=Macroventuria anomochaeta TaxID=301207 RepID=A0ACB6S156_9PLEO|nr:carbohydrate esterase family 4 protein [Macroventuria anomochaeta]KAF2627119.1 carbohydrate esterase family 4 protein [Macroventuria anomochaeta]
MLFSKTVVVAAALAPLASAHGSTGLPKIMGLDIFDRRAGSLIANLKSGGLLGAEANEKSVLEARKDDRECGEGIGSCPQDKCCSISGYCGTTPNHCYSPGCNYKYGPACPENQHPEGTNTSSIPRPKLGSVPYGGTGVFKCKNPGTVALTYDDGPHKDFTDRILDLFKSYNAKATFFITGNNINKGQIDKTQEHINAIKRMNTEGHQIASHTWTHLNLTKISSEDRKNQIWNVEMALNNIVGKIPTYLRPPYSSCDAACQQDMSDLGYHLIYFDVDTDDYEQINASRIQNSKDWFKGNITKGGATPEKNDWLTISHDIIEQTANNLTEYMLSTLTQLGYKAVTVGECLGDPEDNWYRQFGDSADRTGNSSTSTSSSSGSSGTSSATSSPTSPQGSRSTSGGAAPEQTTSSATSALQNTGRLAYAVSALLLSVPIALAL